MLRLRADGNNGAMEAVPDKIEPQRKRRWFQFTLRSLLIFVTLVGCGLGWLGFKVRVAHRQQANVAAIVKLGGNVEYDYDNDAQGNRVPNPTPPGPKWLRGLLGDDFFRDVTGCDLTDKPVTDAELKHVANFAKLKWLFLDGTQVTDAGLEQLEELTELTELSLVRTQITEAGLEHLKGLAQLEELHLYGTQVRKRRSEEASAGIAGLPNPVRSTESTGHGNGSVGRPTYSAIFLSAIGKIPGIGPFLCQNAAAGRRRHKVALNAG